MVFQSNKERKVVLPNNNKYDDISQHRYHIRNATNIHYQEHSTNIHNIYDTIFKKGE